MVTPLFDRLPHNGPITAPFGAIDSLHLNGHSGVDIGDEGRYGAAIISPVISPATVRFVSADGEPGWWWPVFGNSVILEHDGYVSLYAHMRDAPAVSVGEVVSAGTLLGRMGSTGFSSGPHVHWGLAPIANPWLQRNLGLLDALTFVAEPNPAPPPGPVYTYPIPGYRLDYLGLEGGEPYLHVFEVRFETIRVNDFIDIVRMPRDEATGEEIVRLVVQDWAET